MESTTAKENELPLVLSVDEIAGALGVAKSTAYELARHEDFPSFNIGKRVVVYRKNFLKWLENQTKKAV